MPSRSTAPLSLWISRACSSSLLRGIGFGDRRLALPQRFDLGPGQRDAGLVGIDDFVMKARPAIVRDDLDCAFRLLHHRRSIDQSGMNHGLAHGASRMLL